MKDITNIAYNIANYSCMLDIYMYCRRQVTKSQVAILVYHQISPETHGWLTGLQKPEVFRSQLEYLCRNYEIISLDTLVRYIENGKILPRKAVVITFDDGYKNNYVYAYPVLHQYNVPATIFLTTNAIDAGELFWWIKVRYTLYKTDADQLQMGKFGSYSLKTEGQRECASTVIINKLKNMPEELKSETIEKLLNSLKVDVDEDWGKKISLSWEEVREMNNDGINFGAHTHTHPILTNVSYERAWQEIFQSRKVIEENLGQEITTFCYPNGDFNPGISELVKKAGFSCAVSTLPRLVSSKDNLYSLGRISGELDPNRFKMLLSGLYGDMQHLIK